MKINIDYSDLFFSGVYFLINKGKVVYVGESEKIINRIENHRDKVFDDIRVISTKTFYWLDDIWFRLYFERRCIYFFQPEYNDKGKSYPVLLNNFLMRRHLWNQNPQFVDVVSNYCGTEKFNSSKKHTTFMQKWLNHRSRNGKLTRICNYEGDEYECKGYDQFFRTLDLTKKIYIDGGSAFHSLVDITLTRGKLEKMDLNQKMFRPLTKRMHN
jgi:excinuclease UvrABC nuclease subunit